ncbi:MAG: hypothetical protein IJ214_02715 [Clostridia bacterium]|nr:hypothetical protein [Clostridia bacterium]
MYDFNIVNDFKLAGMPFMGYSTAFLINAENRNFNDVDSMVAYMKGHKPTGHAP